MKRKCKKHRQHNKWLVLIAIYKLAQALLFIAIGVGALHLLHKDVDDVFADLADRLRFNPEARITQFLLARASLLNDPLLRRIGLAAFCYAGLSLLEGIGLYLEQTWAEILTIVITASFLPWELLEILRRVTGARVSLFAINIVVVIYLFNLLMSQRRARLANRL
jgi:uncharacterized membrane protein (DUF2068 family)